MNKQTRVFPIPTGVVIMLVLLVAILGYMILTGSSRTPDSLQSGCPVCEHVMYQTDQVNETYITIAPPQESVSDEFTRSMLQVMVCDECGVIYIARWDN